MCAATQSCWAKFKAASPWADVGGLFTMSERTRLIVTGLRRMRARWGGVASRFGALIWHCAPVTNTHIKDLVRVCAWSHAACRARADVALSQTFRKIDFTCAAGHYARCMRVLSPAALITGTWGTYRTTISTNFWRRSGRLSRT